MALVRKKAIPMPRSKATPRPPIMTVEAEDKLVTAPLATSWVAPMPARAVSAAACCTALAASIRLALIS